MARLRRYQVFAEIEANLTPHTDHPLLGKACEDIAHVSPVFRAAITRMQDARAGLPGAASYDGAKTTGGDTGSTTERLALAGDRLAGDRAALDIALRKLVAFTHPVLIDSHTADVVEYAYQLRRIVQVWTPRQATDKDRRAVQAANDMDACQHHATAGIHETTAHIGTVSGNLDVPMALCDYCFWQVRRKGKLPTGEAMDRRHRTGKEERIKA